MNPVINPAVQIAIGVLANTVDQMSRARAANDLIDGLGEALNPRVLEVRRLLKAEWEFSADMFQRDLEAELAKRSDDEAG